MWEKFTERARSMVHLAQEEAKAHGEPRFVGTEYLLLGMLRERENIGVRILERLGLAPERVVAAVEQEIARSKAEQGDAPEPTPEHPNDEQELTRPAKRVIDLAYDEARLLSNDYIGTEHLLLGMLREGNALAARVLAQLEVTLERVREEVNNPLLNMDEAAKFLGISKPTLYRLLNQGELKGLKAGRQWRFNKWDLVAYTHRSPVAAAPAPSEALDVELRFFGDALQQAGQEVPEGDSLPDTGEAKIRLLEERIGLLALAMHASDIHFEPVKAQGEDYLLLRYRVDGRMEEVRRLPFALHEALILGAKQMGSMDMNEKRLPQHGRVLASHAGHDYEFGIATTPTVFGEAITVRIMNRSNTVLSLDAWGIPSEDPLRAWIRNPNGLILFTDPTGSGKDTPLYSCLQEIAAPDRKVISVEDPVEFLLPHTTSIEVNKRTGFTFGAALRSVWRQDPDILLIGSIEDAETARLAAEFAMMGHLVLANLQANSAAEGLRRLLDMEVDPALLTFSLMGILSQRLVRKICTHCKEPYSPETAGSHGVRIREMVASRGYPLPEGSRLYRGRGCDQCRKTGYRGRTALMEELPNSQALTDALLRRASATELHEIAVQQGMRPLFADGVRLALEGITTLDEVLRVMMLSLLP
ncbi:MAG TPA: ATPase, T2SS/T4P/T4SS family [Chthonomonadaceae bacterium]|nr:ATPase, T2SS/T4P/T4SS family [Chthonomonadaceae bacterium]